MKRISSHQGSALLIVIGMLAFMVVSAVAFSAYMRYSRQPSSYLRRSSASRQLIKAALASAIDDIDRAINSNPHPGLGNTPFNKQIGDDYDKGAQSNRNVWIERVLMGTEDNNWLTRARDNNDKTIFDATVPVLTLEGLAYIPPSLVNAARYYGRRSQTAQWQTFDFDAGRYAYVALDVSDYFDVNRLIADSGRSSASSRRITLSHVFEGGKHKSEPSNDATTWDDFLENSKFRKANSALSFDYNRGYIPLVSIADMNLVMGKMGLSNFRSPFYDYIMNGGSNPSFLESVPNYKDTVRGMTFVTDSWFPPNADDYVDGYGSESPYKNDIYDLTSEQSQPFARSLLGEPCSSFKKKTFSEVLSSSQKGMTRLKDYVPSLGLIALCDYLDGDSVPISLACPTVERTPMCCGIEPKFSGTFKVTEEEDGQLYSDTVGTKAPSGGGKAGATRTVYQRVSYMIDGNLLSSAFQSGVRALFAYPFAHQEMEGKTPSFTLKGRAEVFFTDSGDGVKLRSGDASSGSSSSSDAIHFKSKSYEGDIGLNADGVFMLPFNQVSFVLPTYGSSLTEQNVVKDYSFTTAGASQMATDVSGKPLLEVWYSWEQTWDTENNIWNPEQRENDKVSHSRCGIPVLGADGAPSAKFRTTVGPDEVGGSANLCVAIHVQVIDGNGNTVDLVPAHIEDDKLFNGVSNDGELTAADLCGQNWPVLLFNTGVTVDFTSQGMGDLVSGKPIGMSPVALTVSDPRFNYAPESWTSGNLDGWINEVHNFQGQKGLYDRDIFMATSDQGYLQSIYELAFLPELSDLSQGSGSSKMGSLPALTTRDWYAADAGSAYGNEVMWTTFMPYGENENDVDKFELMGFSSAGNGFKINPYTDSSDIMMAAFANTPLDWRYASTNNVNADYYDMPAADFNAKYAWNEYGSGATVRWEDLKSFAEHFMDKVANGNLDGRYSGYTTSYVNWKRAWQELGWHKDQEKTGKLCEEDMTGSPIWSVDRKFFFGFWRDCFAAKQQLFLVFVRAEPNMMGGRGQLGARAVAVVWRDPAPGKEYPHRTRVLFYRQLD